MPTPRYPRHAGPYRPAFKPGIGEDLHHEDTKTRREHEEKKKERREQGKADLTPDAQRLMPSAIQNPKSKIQNFASLPIGPFRVSLVWVALAILAASILFTLAVISGRG